MAYEQGLQADPASDVLKKGLNEVKKAMDADMDSPFGPGGDMGLGRMFSDPGLVAKLENNPKTKEYMKDPSFRHKIAQLQSGGGKTDLQGMMGDPRMLTVLGVAMGIDIVSACSRDRIDGRTRWNDQRDQTRCHREWGDLQLLPRPLSRPNPPLHQKKTQSKTHPSRNQPRSPWTSMIMTLR